MHLLVNHLPIVFPIAAVLVLLGGIIFKSDTVIRTSYAIFVMGALACFLAMSTGEDAEHMVEHMAGITHDRIHVHEGLAELFTIVSSVLGVVCLVAFWASWKKRPFARTMAYVVLAGAVVILYFGAKAANAGGEISHTEIRDDAASQTLAEPDGD